MEIGLDVHGVIDRYPNLMRKFASSAIDKGHEIHIVTGQEECTVLPAIERLDIPYSEFFSIVDYHKSIGTSMYTRSDKVGWWMDRELWMRSKGDYAERIGLNIHFDDTLEYGRFFPSHCTFVHVPSEDFGDILRNLCSIF